MDSASKQTAVVAEVTQGATPSSPGFKLTRDIRVTGAPQRANNRSPERRADRMAASMVTGLSTFPKAIELPWARDAATDILWESALGGAWSTDVLKNASTKKFFTLEEKYEGGSTDPYRRLLGAMCDKVDIAFRTDGNPGTVSFALKALRETTATSAIASSTYAAPSPGYDPSSSSEITVTNLFSISSPKVMGFQASISNNLREQWAFGSPDPFGLGFGLFDVIGQVQLYFTQLSDYSTFTTRQTGLALDFTIGSVTNYKDQLQLMNVDVWNPDVDDPGASGDHMVTLNFLAKYHASDTAAIKLTRNVA